MNPAANLIKLDYLYTLEMLGEEFCEDLPIPKEETKQSLGQSPDSAVLGFVSRTPLIGPSGNFLPKKSSQMLQNIITQVFGLSQQDCCILSLFKTELCDQEREHAQILSSQIAQSSARIFVIFGDVAQILLPRLELGSSAKLGEKTCIATHSLSALLRLPTLKRQTLEHLRLAKALL